MTVEDAAHLAGVSVGTIRRWMQNGWLKPEPGPRGRGSRIVLAAHDVMHTAATRPERGQPRKPTSSDPRVQRHRESARASRAKTYALIKADPIAYDEHKTRSRESARRSRDRKLARQKEAGAAGLVAFNERVYGAKHD